MKTQSLLVAALAASLAGAAAASPGEYEDEYQDDYVRRGPMPFEVFDRNQDGVISREEHAEVRSERLKTRAEAGFPLRGAGNAPAFEQIDTDADGSISPAEYRAFHANRVRPRFGYGGRGY